MASWWAIAAQQGKEMRLNFLNHRLQNFSNLVTCRHGSTHSDSVQGGRTFRINVGRPFAQIEHGCKPLSF